MLKLIGTAVVFWVIWRILDSLVSKKQKLPDLKPGQFIIQTKSGEHYVVQEAPEEPESEEPEPDTRRADNVVKFPMSGRHG